MLGAGLDELNAVFEVIGDESGATRPPGVLLLASQLKYEQAEDELRIAFADGTRAVVTISLAATGGAQAGDRPGR
jgi:hypothetical protein